MDARALPGTRASRRTNQDLRDAAYGYVASLEASGQPADGSAIHALCIGWGSSAPGDERRTHAAGVPGHATRMLTADRVRRIHAQKDAANRTALFPLGHWLKARGIDA
jgi:hypothetical protein